jgi:hypothetical protein
MILMNTLICNQIKKNVFLFQSTFLIKKFFYLIWSKQINNKKKPDCASGDVMESKLLNVGMANIFEVWVSDIFIWKNLNEVTTILGWLRK